MTVTMTHHFEIEARPAVLGGGWKLRLLQQEGGEDRNGRRRVSAEPEQGVSADDAYADAVQMGED